MHRALAIEVCPMRATVIKQSSAGRKHTANPIFKHPIQPNNRNKEYCGGRSVPTTACANIKYPCLPVGVRTAE